MVDHNAFHDSISAKIKRDVEDVYTDGTFSLVGKVQYDNAPFERPNNILWAHFMIQDGTSLQKSFGDQGNNRDRTQGIVMAVTYGQLEIGDAAQIKLCNFIKNAFRKVTDACVVFQVPSLTVIGRFESWHQVQVACPFYVDDFS